MEIYCKFCAIFLFRATFSIGYFAYHRCSPVFLSTFFQAVTNKKKKLEKSLEFPISTTIRYPNFNYFFKNSFYSTISIFNYFNFCFEQFNIPTLMFIIIIESTKILLWTKFFDTRGWSYLTHTFIIIRKNKYSFIRKLSYLKHHISLNSNIITFYLIFIDENLNKFFSIQIKFLGLNRFNARHNLFITIIWKSEYFFPPIL